MFHQYVVPTAMVYTIITTSHDNSGHNGFRRTYNAVKRHFFWCRMKKDILQYCKHCMKCNLYKTQKYEFIRKTFSPGVQPMEFISKDLIGRMSPPSLQGHQYALTVICMLTGFTFCIPLKTKNTEEIVDAYLKYVVCTFGASRKILPDNGTEFKNKHFDKVAEKFGIQRKVYRLSYRPQANGRIKGFHKYLKECIGKHI